METPFVLCVKKVFRAGVDTVSFRCHGATSYDEAKKMVRTYINSVRAGHEETYDSIFGTKSAYWGDLSKDFPEWRLLYSGESYAETDLYVDGVHEASTVRTGSMETVNLYSETVISINKLSTSGRGTIVFTCKGAVSKAMAFDMVLKHIHAVRAGRKAPAALGEGWGETGSALPLMRTSYESGNEISIDWCEGTPVGLRCRANILITLPEPAAAGAGSA